MVVQRQPELQAPPNTEWTTWPAGCSTTVTRRWGDDGLVLHHLDMAEPLPLRHSEGDNFSSSVVFLNTIAFERAGNGRITGFAVSNGRTKGVWFQKM